MSQNFNANNFVVFDFQKTAAWGQGTDESTFLPSRYKRWTFKTFIDTLDLLIDISNFSPKGSCFCEVLFLIAILPNKSTQICKINKQSFFNFTFKQKDTPVRVHYVNNPLNMNC